MRLAKFYFGLPSDAESVSEISWDLSFSKESTGRGIERCLSWFDNLGIIVEGDLV